MWCMYTRSSPETAYECREQHSNSPMCKAGLKCSLAITGRVNPFVPCYTHGEAITTPPCSHLARFVQALPLISGKHVFLTVAHSLVSIIIIQLKDFWCDSLKICPIKLSKLQTVQKAPGAAYSLLLCSNFPPPTMKNRNHTTSPALITPYSLWALRWLRPLEQMPEGCRRNPSISFKDFSKVNYSCCSKAG